MAGRESSDVLPSISGSGSDKHQANSPRLQDAGAGGSLQTDLRLQETKQQKRLDSISVYSDRSVYDEAYPKKTGNNSRQKKMNDFCFRTIGLCANPNKAHVTADDLPVGQGVWPSNFHSMCMKLAVYIGTTEYILGPRLAWHYGGFIFYFVVVFLILATSLPMNFLESIVGQYSAKGLVVFLPQLGPVFRGLGYAMFIISVMIMAYYAGHIAYILVYAYHAAQESVKWNTCSPDYNSKYCFSEELQDQCNQRFNHAVYYDFQCVPAATYCQQNGYIGSNGTHCFRTPGANLTSRWMIDFEEHELDSSRTAVNAIGSVGRRYISTRDFFYHYVRGQDECTTHPSLLACQNHNKAFAVAYGVVWLLALLPCFNLWIVSTFAVAVVVASPVVILLVMTRVLLFPGAWAGISNFFFGRANIRQLLHSSFWVDAIGMTFWSIGVGTGVVSTLSSRDRQRHSALRSSAILVSVDLAFGFLNSLLLFAVRGHLEQAAGLDGDQLRQLDHDSEALVFVAFTTITDAMMPRPRFWGSVYFGTMAAQAVGTVAVFVVSAALNLVDAVPALGRRPFAAAVLVAAAPFLLVAAVLVASVLRGVRWSVYPLVRLQLMVVSILFVVVVGFKLSAPAFRDQLQARLGLDVSGVWRWIVISWLVVCPLFMVFQLMNELWVYALPPVPAGAVPTAVITYIAMTLPLLAVLGGAVYAGRTTPFWDLWSTTEQFGARAERERQRRGSSRAPRAGARSPSGHAHRRTDSSASGRRVAAMESEDRRWEMAKRSTLLTVA